MNITYSVSVDIRRLSNNIEMYLIYPDKTQKSLLEVIDCGLSYDSLKALAQSLADTYMLGANDSVEYFNNSGKVSKFIDKNDKKS